MSAPPPPPIEAPPPAPTNVVPVGGLPVHFPVGRTPFAAQRALMARVIAAANAGSHALLESPTGTGKTLALLSSALAYQAKRRQDAAVEWVRFQRERRGTDAAVAAAATAAAAAAGGAAPPPARAAAAAAASQAGAGAPAAANLAAAGYTYPALALSGDKPPPGPRIFVASRTHSQLAQVVRELKRCSAYMEPRGVVNLGIAAAVAEAARGLQLVPGALPPQPQPPAARGGADHGLTASVSA